MHETTKYIITEIIPQQSQYESNLCKLNTNITLEIHYTEFENNNRAFSKQSLSRSKCLLGTYPVVKRQGALLIFGHQEIVV